MVCAGKKAWVPKLRTRTRVEVCAITTAAKFAKMASKVCLDLGVCGSSLLSAGVLLFGEVGAIKNSRQMGSA